MGTVRTIEITFQSRNLVGREYVTVDRLDLKDGEKQTETSYWFLANDKMEVGKTYVLQQV